MSNNQYHSSNRKVISIKYLANILEHKQQSYNWFEFVLYYQLDTNLEGILCKLLSICFSMWIFRKGEKIISFTCFSMRNMLFFCCSIFLRDWIGKITKPYGEYQLLNFHPKHFSCRRCIFLNLNSYDYLFSLIRYALL